MRKKIILPVLAAGALLFASMPGHAAGTTDPTTTVIEPILVKADAQVPIAQFRSGALGAANITGFDLDAAGGTITARITTASPVPRTPLAAATFAPPYTGVHVMIEFQAGSQEILEDVGCSLRTDAAGPCPSTANPTVKWIPIYRADRQFYEIAYGVVANEEDNDSWLGIYDPTGRIGVGRIGLSGVVPAGQVWLIQGQRTQVCAAGQDPPGWLPAGRGNSTNVSFGGNDVTITIPYDYRWLSANTCIGRHKQIVTAGEDLDNAVAFSWLDHTITGPEVGLIFGWTWYTDSVPKILGAPGPGSFGYKVGTPAGDPNVAAVARQNCYIQLQGQQVNPLYSPGPCMTANPIGPGFALTGISDTAT